MCFSCAAIALLSLLSPLSSEPRFSEHTFQNPIDALSVSLEADQKTAVSYFTDNGWSEWQEMTIENEQDPLLNESNLVMFPKPITKIRLQDDDAIALHPIRIDHAPVTYEVAATNSVSRPKILTRRQWGADDSLLYVKESSTPPSSTPPSEQTDNGEAAVPQRVKDCETAQLNYPHEFKTERTVREDADGKRYRWPRTYSKDVQLIAVHHTAVAVNGDRRSGIERVRALYQYHANNRGWGDVGYHYLIDEDGQIYEGKSGGKYVVGGHAYCHNVGTVGVAMLGNFQIEQPTQTQMKALQWLLDELADTYDIDVTRNVTFHGKTTHPIVGHGDLVSTECPGYYVEQTLAQVRDHVENGDLTASITFPRPIVASKPRVNRTQERLAQRQAESKPSKYATGTLTRAARRLLNTQASQNLRRKLGTNPGRETEEGVARRLAERWGNSSSSLRRTVLSRQSSSKKSLTSRSSRPIVRRSSSSRSRVTASSPLIRIRLTKQEKGEASCEDVNLSEIQKKYRGSVSCLIVDGKAAIINAITLEQYLDGLAEEPDTEPYEKQRAFAIAARSYAAYYMEESHRKFPGKPYDGSDSPAEFQAYGGIAFEQANPRWVKAVRETANEVLMVDGEILRAPYYSSNDGRTYSPEEAGWRNFPFADVFSSKPDPWCAGMEKRGHGVGMSGCGSEGQANEGKTAEEILSYYYPGTALEKLR